MTAIFLTYRRGEASHAAGRLGDVLGSRFGRDAVFLDVDTIEAGRDFTRRIAEAIDSSQAMVVLIGRDWLEARNEQGNRRLDDPRDYVRQEVRRGLERGERDLRVIPVLLDGALMPNAADLPTDIRDLALRNALSLTHWTWKEDIDRLRSKIEEVVWPIESGKRLRGEAITAAKKASRRVQSRADDLKSPQSKTFFAPELDLRDLARYLVDFFQREGMQAQPVPVRGGHLVQARRGGARSTLGLGIALKVLLKREGDDVTVELGSGKWMDKAVAAGISPWIPPLLFTSAWGAWRQAKLSGRTYQAIEVFLSSRSSD